MPGSRSTCPRTRASVQLRVGTLGAPGPPLEVFTPAPRDPRAAPRSAAGYGDGTTVAASPAGIAAGRRIEVCVRNAGRRNAALYGGAPQAARTSALMVEGRDAGTDLTLVFERGESRSFLSALGDAFDRAALFHPPWVSAGLLCALAVLLVGAAGGAGAALRASLPAASTRRRCDREAVSPVGR